MGVTLLAIDEASLEPSLFERLAPDTSVAVIVDSLDRRTTLEILRTYPVDHVVPRRRAEVMLTAILDTLQSGRCVGLDAYLPSATLSSWSLHESAEKPAVLDGIQQLATAAGCHPRIVDLLLAAVDEMVINALYRPAQVDPRRPVTVTCGADGHALGVAVRDSHGAFRREDLGRAIAKALEVEDRGIPTDATHGHLGFRIMLQTLGQLVINVDPDRCTEIIGLVELGKGLKEHRSAVPAFSMFVAPRA